jgi:hypothetical protein
MQAQLRARKRAAMTVPEHVERLQLELDEDEILEVAICLLSALREGLSNPFFAHHVHKRNKTRAARRASKEARS